MSAQRFDTQRLVNFYVELSPLGQGKEAQIGVILSTPGLRLRSTFGSDPIRGIYTPTIGGVSYAVSGNKLYSSSNNFQTSSLVGTLQTSNGPVQFADNGSAVTDSKMMLIDGTYGYTFSISNPASTFTQITDPQFYASTSITFQDGYFILNRLGTGYFFISDLNDVTFPDLNEALKSGYGDNIVAVISNNRELYLLGTRTTEFWYNSGASGITPFQRIDGKFSNTGCASAASVKKLGDTIFFVGPNEQGGGIVYSMKGGLPSRISNHAVELALQSVSFDDLSNVIAWAYQTNGHYFYNIVVPGLDTTWTFDLATGLWSERTSTSSSNKQIQHLVNTITFNNNELIVGDRTTGNIYVLDNNYYLDGGSPILRKRVSPHISSNLNNAALTLVQLDVQSGVGNWSGLENEIDPKITLRVSRDGGLTYSLPRTASIGKIGRYTTRQRWTRCGYARDFVLEFSCSDPVPLSILSGWMSLEVFNA
jgi:Phage stabilisation protein